MNIRDVKQTVYKEMAGMTKALGNPNRLEILDLLAQGPASVEYIAEQTHLSTANASQHLQVLKNAKLVKAEREWKHNYYSLSNQKVFQAWCALRQLGFSQNAELNQLIGEYQREHKELRSVSHEELISLKDREDVVILDVRPEKEYEMGHINQAVSLPKSDIEKRLHELDKNKKIVVYCRGPFCFMADEVVRFLNKNGYSASALEDGFPDWAAKNLPVKTG